MQKVKGKCQEIELTKKEEKKTKGEIKKWQKPTLEDVSSKVMAQPYIRFT